jgi:hypothetical protein
MTILVTFMNRTTKLLMVKIRSSIPRKAKMKCQSNTSQLGWIIEITHPSSHFILTQMGSYLRVDEELQISNAGMGPVEATNEAGREKLPPP